MIQHHVSASAVSPSLMAGLPIIIRAQPMNANLEEGEKEVEA